MVRPIVCALAHAMCFAQIVIGTVIRPPSHTVRFADIVISTIVGTMAYAMCFANIVIRTMVVATTAVRTARSTVATLTTGVAVAAVT
ncbi:MULTISPECIES: hypothetical protein [unclassified Pseudomonas]|jgi:hypothetical protein|uniref:hypothetical protein n=1 Tax=unclassified Pseudomonas TaxID=196821 RepID=UPI000EAA9AC1|nr:hypothetical protein [Pseudomonas sp. JG-B]AYF86811.1 hypothetical protein D6Z43_06445 [Pseudomonas sp. DY-1]MDH4652222.1 hypothetical protein [Pseudomonas sp. BN606]